MKSTPLFFFITMTFLLYSCKKENQLETPIQHERIISDTAYGEAPQQKMDIYLPANRNANTKTIVLIHGGGWSEGSKADLNSGIATIRELFPEYALVAINYRLANEWGNKFPTQENDVQSVMSFLTAHHQDFQISSKFVLAGFSAGAHLAMLHAYKNDPNKNVVAVVDFFGPTNLETLWNEGLVQQLILFNATGKIYPDGQEIYSSSSPINFVSNNTPPTILLQGGNDPLVPPSQTTTLITKLEEHNITHKLVYYPDEAHGWGGDKLNHSLQEVQAFLKEHVK